MMTYDDFKQNIQDNIKELLPDQYADCNVQIREVIKNNDIVLDGLTILDPEENITPTIYLNSLFKDYESGRPMEAIMQSIANSYIENISEMNFDISLITDFENVKDKIVCKVVNKEANELLLDTLPHKEVEDLAVIYQIALASDEQGAATINISNEILERYDIAVDKLHDLAVENTEALRPASFRSMKEVLFEMFQEQDMSMDVGIEDIMAAPDDGMPLYVLTNDHKLHGAAAMLYPSIMDEIAEKVGGDFFVLPSSTHELLIISKESGAKREQLENMVQEVNATQVEPEEVLSNHVYEYDAKEHELFRGDKAEERQKRKEIEKAVEKEADKVVEKVDKTKGIEKENQQKERQSLKQKLPEMKAKAEAMNATHEKSQGLKKENSL